MKKNMLIITGLIVISLITVEIFAWGGQGRGRGRGDGYRNSDGYGNNGGNNNRGRRYRRGGNNNGFGIGAGNFEFLKNEVGVSDKQLEQISQINSKFRIKYYKNRNNRLEIDKIRIEHREAVKKVLTAKQNKIFEDYYNSRGNRSGYGNRGYRRGRR